MTNYIGDFLLDIVSISTDRNKDEFDPDQIEAIARTIVNLRGIINPLIVRKTGYNADGEALYELVEGHLEYFSAQRAMELDPKLEMVRAFVIEPDQADTCQQQVALLRTKNINSVVTPTIVNIDYHSLTRGIVQQLQPHLQTIQQELNNLKNEIAVLKSHSPPTNKPTSKNKNRKNLPSLTPNQRLVADQFAQAVNQITDQELYEKLKPISNRRKFIPHLLAQRPFQDIHDLYRRTPQIRLATLFKILEAWQAKE
ncbi:MAG: ParB N-terminal domain-containing protein [Pseudanabaenaceae cyanobacterium]